MRLLIVGSVALDSIETPFGRADEVLGGSATYCATAASYFTRPSVVGVVGEDFPERHIVFLRSRGVDLTGLTRAAGSTFRWRGRYGYDLNQAQTLETRLNVFEHFSPEIPPALRDAEGVFLANIDPVLQDRVLTQVRAPKFVALDTMNYWIQGKSAALEATMRKVHAVVINEAEARMVAGDPNLVTAARAIRALGPQTVIIKRGEYGALMFYGSSVFAAPAYPLECIFDPTGAGDSFAGGLLGYLAQTGTPDETTLRRAMITGSVMASFCVEAFSLDRLATLTDTDIRARYVAFQHMTRFEDL